MRRWLLIPLCLAATVAPGFGDDKKPDAKKDLPKVIVAFPLGLAPGKETKLVLRGLRLDEATEVRLHDPKASVKIQKKEKAPPPAKDDAARFGDTQVEILATLSADFAGDQATLVVVTPAGESVAHALMVDHHPDLIVSEKEPNNGFRQAQAVQLPQIIEGRIGVPMDVDVFRFDGKERQRVVLEVFAARFGSTLDSVLTLYDADGRILASNDDADRTTTDSRLEFALPKTGAYLIGLQDANDTGGPAHNYRLSLRIK